ncbi:enoyl-CoA hydratase/isomerase family protein [Desulfobacter curvatus]|uniref:enoyl-CoA hydratase/isomerase family protein n=1 Tax=Desulfobacter curvatus TaxID=2290 RepID=UPI0003763EBC|nr:enoyl-CoA hydratase-related protein [Desulfobacter curvatus]
MAYETIIAETLDGHVASVTLNRTEAMNTFSSQMAEELYDALKKFDTAPDVRVILIKGAGRAFCAGIDVNELKGKTTNQYREWIEKMEAPLVLMSKMQTPVIAQVHGAAAANGMGLVAASDLAIAADNVKMGLTAINVGLNCVGPVIPVARCVGQKKALELLLYGELIKADQALELGLINRVVSKDDLDEVAIAWARDLAKKSPVAVKIAKSAFYASRDMPYEAQFAYMNEAFARLCDTNDAKEGVAAFFEKRAPVWQEK